MNRMNFYDVPQMVRLSVQFTTDDTNVGIDPTTVTLHLTRPDGSKENHDDVANDPGVGAYHYDLIVDQRGEWHYQWEGGGAVVATSPLIGFGAG